METKAHILETAEQLARQRGFDGFSYADLEEAIGIRKASIHYHYPTKGDLSLAVVNQYARAVMAEFATKARRSETAAQSLLAFMDVYRQALDGGQRLCLCVALSVTQTALPPETRAALDQFHTDVVAWLQSVFVTGLSDGSIRDVSDPRSEAHAALAVVEGAQIMARSSQDMSRFEAAISLLRARCL